ncbi:MULTISPECIES: glycoside hydrolase family 88 protein [unclassified Alteromonas]|uniref:glycoside hydrolase family 88 protein n=1 Tax=unclassified Alteromonas TaxID=2614992 RepID=UPI000509CBCD|nr:MULTISPECIES: glycoside hydrolase family 88 protein [unclassified Alteromonas]
MLKNVILIGTQLLTFIALAACSQEHSGKHEVLQKEVLQSNIEIFTAEDAGGNLTFTKNQYLKMANHIEAERYLYYRPACVKDTTMICVPRSYEHGGIFLDKYEKWTNGFFPGLIWKILSNKEYVKWSGNEERQLLSIATHYQRALDSDATLKTTHDLGFMLYDSYGEALNYEDLSDELRSKYVSILAKGRETLSRRFNEEKGVIKSWDFVPHMKVSVSRNGKDVVELHKIAQPWTYPVIIDNMMNLEYLLDSDSFHYKDIAITHAKTTLKNHYFYEDSDLEKRYPIAYHVFDYDKQKPGNWQGLGNVSAWARGQGWSLYGYVTIVDYMSDLSLSDTERATFETHLNNVLNSIGHLLEEDLVPFWDFWANRSNAFEYAENTSQKTSVYSGILELCANRIDSHILPYKGYRPQILDASILTSESLNELKNQKNWYGSDILQGDNLVPCGREPYPATHTKIPRDTSAAAIYASALYRYATITEDENRKQKYGLLADKIMAELTNNYRTDRNKNGRDKSFELGFVLNEATGDMGNAGEIDTPIIYGDFYFVEANIRKLEFERSRGVKLKIK